METPRWIGDLFEAIDRGDVDGFARFLTDDVRFRMGNSQSLEGIEAVRAGVSGFLSSIRSVQHRLDDALVGRDQVAVHGSVTYTRHDGSELTAPFANIFNLESEKIRDYLIFIDNTEL